MADPPVNRMTGVKTLPCRNFVAGGKKNRQTEEVFASRHPSLGALGICVDIFFRYVYLNSTISKWCNNSGCYFHILVNCCTNLYVSS